MALRVFNGVTGFYGVTGIEGMTLSIIYTNFILSGTCMTKGENIIILFFSLLLFILVLSVFVRAYNLNCNYNFTLIIKDNN